MLTNRIEKLLLIFGNDGSKSVLMKYFMNLLLLLGILGIAPFIINCFFVNPVSDDFIFANTSLQHGAFQAQINWYQNWTGRYFSTFLLCNSPLVYHWLPGYKILPIILLGTLFLSIFVLLKSVSGKQFSTKTNLIFALIVLFIYLHRFPSSTWGLYWMTGAITYQLANISTLFLMSVLVRITRKSGNNKQTAIFTTIGSVLIIIAVGCNEITMLLINALLFTVLIVDYSLNRKINYHLLWLMLITLAFSVFVFMSPGRGIREIEWGQSHQLLPSIVATLRRTISQIIYRLIWSPLLIFSIIAFPLLNRLGTIWSQKKTVIFNINPLVAFAWMLFLPALFFPLHYSLGPNEPHAERITNIIFLFFILCWFYFEILLITYIKRTKKFSIPNKPISSIFWWLLLMFYGFFPFREHNQIRTAYEDIFTGESYMHNKLLNERVKYLQESDCTDCSVLDIPYHPETIAYKWFYVNGRKDFWMNQQAAKYFGKKSIFIEKSKNIKNQLNQPK